MKIAKIKRSRRMTDMQKQDKETVKLGQFSRKIKETRLRWSEYVRNL